MTLSLLSCQKIHCPAVERSADKIDPKTRQIMREVTEGVRPWPLVFVGKAGTGKTCAALCLVDRARGMYRTLMDWCDQLRRAQMDGVVMPGGSRTINHFELWDRWSNARLAVLDEIGTRSNVSDHHYETVKKSIDSRQGKPAVFISNLELSEIATVYDDRIASRMACGTVIGFSGKDRRLS